MSVLEETINLKNCPLNTLNVFLAAILSSEVLYCIKKVTTKILKDGVWPPNSSVVKYLPRILLRKLFLLSIDRIRNVDLMIP